jgi:hypothetical protein
MYRVICAPHDGRDCRDAFRGCELERSLPAHRGHSGGCKVCAHIERTRIELLLAGGAGQKAVGRKYGLTKDSVHRHWKNHVSEERRVALIMGPMQRQALAAQVAEESESVLDHHQAVRAGLYRLYDAAVTAGDRTGGAMLGGRLTEVNNAIARLCGQLASSPLIQNNTVNFYLSPEFASFQADLVRALGPFPEARAAVLAEFERLEAAAPAELPALEHEAHVDAAP